MKETIKKTSLVFLTACLLLLTACRENRNEWDGMTVLNIKNDPVSDVFTARVNGVSVPVTVVPPLKQAESEKMVKLYQDLPEYCHVESRSMTLHFVHLALEKNPEIEIDTKTPIKNFVIYPKRLKIAGKVKRSVLRFGVPLDAGRFILVRIDHYPMFVLIIEPHEIKELQSDDPAIVSLREFITDKDKGDFTKVFEHAIYSLNGSGKTLYVPKGEYLTGEIRIRNCKNLNIYLDKGAIIRTKTDTEGNNTQRRGIWIDHCNNIKIEGYGTLDHQAYENYVICKNRYDYGFRGYAFYSEFKDVGGTDPFLFSPLFVTDSKNITLRDFTVRNGRIFNVNVRHSGNIRIINLKILTPSASSPEWNDGIVVGSTKNIIVDSCFVYSNDDPISAGHNLVPYDSGEMDGFIIRNTCFWNPRANGFRLGWALNTQMGKILFSHCDFGGNNKSAFVIHKHQKKHLCYPQIRFEDCTFDDVARYEKPLFRINNACLRKLELIDVHFDTIPEKKAVNTGDIDTLYIKNVFIGKKKISKENINDYITVGNVRHLIIE